jgi:hypothetical protein
MLNFLSVRLRFTDFDYPFGIFKLFLKPNILSSTCQRSLEGEIYTKLFQYDQSLLQYDGNVIYRDILYGVKQANFHRWRVVERS